MDGRLCSYGRGPNSASVTMLGGPRTPADLLIPPNYLVALMQTRRRTFIVERYFSHGLQSRWQAERRTAMRNPKQGQCASPHMSQSDAAAVKNASICSSVKPMAAKPTAMVSSVRMIRNTHRRSEPPWTAKRSTRRLPPGGGRLETVA